MRLRDLPLAFVGILILATFACIYMIFVGPYNYFKTGEFWI
jgi:hypothetical protein